LLESNFFAGIDAVGDSRVVDMTLCPATQRRFATDESSMIRPVAVMVKGMEAPVIEEAAIVNRAGSRLCRSGFDFRSSASSARVSPAAAFEFLAAPLSSLMSLASRR